MKTRGRVQEDRVKQLFLDLAQINSPSLKEKKLGEFVQTYLGKLGLEVAQNEPIEGGDCGNVWGVLPGTGQKTMLLAAHLDTVEPTEGICCLEAEGTICTDGTTILGADDKAGIAAILEAVQTVMEQDLPHPTVYTLFTVGEEVGLLGIKSQQELPRIDFGYVVDSDGPPGTIVNQAPSHYDFEAVIHGRAAHAGVAPEQGINAIAVAAEAIRQIQFGRLSDITTSNIGVIHGGRANNVVPDRVTLTGEVRSLDEAAAKAQLEQIRKLFADTAAEHGASFCLKVRHSYASYHISPEHSAVVLAQQAARRVGITPLITRSGGGTDASILNERGITTLPLGMGVTGEHTREERIRMADLKKVAAYVTEMIIQAAS